MAFPPLLRSGQPLEDVEDPLDLEHHVAARLAAQDLRRRVAALPEPGVTVVRWRYGIEAPELPPHEIARRLGVAPTAIYRVQERALQALRDSYAHQPR